MDRGPAAASGVAIDMTLAPEAPYPACVQARTTACAGEIESGRLERRRIEIGVYGSSTHLCRAPACARAIHATTDPPAGNPNIDATVAYVATRSPISNTFARFQNAEEKKRDSMIKNNKTFFVPWETIHESNPQEILERREKVTLVPLLVMQGALDDNVLPAAQEKFVATYKAAGGEIEYHLFPDSVHEWVAEPGVQTDRAREMAKAFIARNQRSG
jgi:acetyl esterase/lipase